MKITSVVRAFVTHPQARRKSRSAACTAAILVAFAAGGASTAAHAQQVSISMTRSLGGPGGSGMVSKRSIEKYAALIGFTPEQLEQAVAIHSGYAAAYEGKQKAFRDAIDEIRRTSEDSGDHTVFMERMPAVDKERTDSTRKLEADLFADLKALATGKQEDAWPKVERMRRRETGLVGGSMSGESMDVIELVDDFKLDGEAAKAVSQVLDSYELELDRMLVARAAKADDGPGFEPGKPIDIEKIQEAMAKAREEGAKVRDLNRDAARKVQDLLPDDRKPAFEAAVRKRTFPRVYKTSRVSRELDAALAMSDLDAAQREQLGELKATYSRDLDPANSAWSKAIEESEASGQSGAMGGGGGRISMAFGDDPEPLKNARKTRRELDEGASKKLRTILNEQQRSKLPKPSEGEEEGPMVGGANLMMIRGGE